jgi:hypothetical protein
MYTLIQKIGDYYLLSSVQKHITTNNKQHDVDVKYSKRYQNIFDRGCMYKDETMSQPVVKPFNEVLKMKATTNIKDIVNLFFTQKEIRKRSELRYPKLLKNVKSYIGHRGGNEQVRYRYLSSDDRRNVLTYEYKHGNTNSSYVIKIAKTEHYSCAYKDESSIYKHFQTLSGADNGTDSDKGTDIIKYIKSGEVESILDDDNRHIISIDIHNKQIILNNVGNELIGKHYLVLENTNTQNFIDFSEYIKSNNNIDCVKVFNKIMQTIKHKKTAFGFFHGDLHADNVKVRQNANNVVDIKLFDFDFSGIISSDPKIPKIISRNMLNYNLKKQDTVLFRVDPTSNEDTCNNVIINKPSLEINNFMFAFDYFRLLFSMILEFQNKIEAFDLLVYKEYILKVDEPIYLTIINWFNSQVKQPEWKFCFRDSYFFESIFKYTSFTEKTPQVCSTQNISQVSQEQPQHISNVLAALKLTSSDASSDFGSSGGFRKKKIGVKTKVIKKNKKQIRYH